MAAGEPARPAVTLLNIDAAQAGQRIDNFLIKRLKGVPKTRLYRALRTGEVRVNGGRIKALYLLQAGDRVRIPPIRCAEPRTPAVIPPDLLRQIPVLFEDADLLVVNKPAGLAAHGGSGQAYGLIEAMRALRRLPELQLAHRLDRETSGCLILCHNRPALVAIQQQLGRPGGMQKRYLALLNGRLDGPRTVTTALETVITAGKKRVQAGVHGQAAHSEFRVIEHLPQQTLVGIELKTGRMHQARAHAAGLGHAIAGDPLYGDDTCNQRLRRLGLGRLFLHAEKLAFQHPTAAQRITVRAALPAPLAAVLEKIRAATAPSV